MLVIWLKPPLDTELKPLELHTGKCSECQACRNASWLDEKKIEADEFFFELFGKN